MAISKILTFENPDEWEFDDNIIELVNNTAKLKLIDYTSQSFIQSFDSDEGFLYNNAITEFDDGECFQIDLKPSNSLCWITYDNQLDLNYGNGNRTASPTGTPLPTITNNQLDLTGDVVRYVSYEAIQNAQIAQVGTIKLVIEPNYTGPPPTRYTFFTLSEADGSSNNLIELSQSPGINRVLRLRIYDFAGSVIVDEILEGWSGGSSNPVEIQINFDFNAGKVRYFRNGNRIRVIDATGVRNTNINLLRIGSDFNGTNKANFFIKDFIIYDNVQNTTDYTPGYSLPERRYLEDIITFPPFVYEGVGSIKAYLNFITLQIGNIRFNINGLYWDGGAWVTSNNTYDQMNSPVDINANLGLLDAFQSITLRMRTINSDIRLSISNLDMVYSTQIFIQNFISSFDFECDSDKTEFVSGKLQQVDQAPIDFVSWVTYLNSINLNVGGGVLTGTDTGSPVIADGYLKFTNVLGQRVDYNAVDNSDVQQTGSIKFKLVPQYTGNPTTDQTFLINTKANSDTTNLLGIQHLNTGAIRILLRDQSDVNNNITFAGVWSPISSLEYEFSYNFDYTGGANRLFINGTQFSTTDTTTLTRSSDIGLYRVGNNDTSSGTPYFWIKDLIIFDTVQHVVDYTPGYDLEETRYLSDLVTLPSFLYEGVGNILQYTDFTTVLSGGIRFNLNGLYWDGAAWIVSNDSYSQMSSTSEVDTNLIDHPPQNFMIIKLRTQDSNTQQFIDNLILDYTGQIYSTDNPTVILKDGILIRTLNAFSEIVSPLIGEDSITYTQSITGFENYYNELTSTWENSTGYPETNTANVVNANLSTLSFGEGQIYKPVIYFHSEDGTSTPVIASIFLEYELFTGLVSEDILRIMVQDPSGPDEILTSVDYDVVLSIETDLYFSSALAAKMIAAVFARRVRVKVGPVNVDLQKKYEHYIDLAETYEKRGRENRVMNPNSIVGVGVALTGTSKDTMRDLRQDTDRYGSVFYRGMNDNPPESDDDFNDDRR